MPSVVAALWRGPVSGTLGVKSQVSDVAAIEVSDSEYFRLSEFERFNDGSGYRCCVDVRTGEFGCYRKHFYFDDLAEVVSGLRDAHRTLKGNVEMRQRYEREVITFSAGSRGHFLVKGYLTDYSDLELRFALDVDQTYLPPFIVAMENLRARLHA